MGARFPAVVRLLALGIAATLLVAGQCASVSNGGGFRQARQDDGDDGDDGDGDGAGTTGGGGGGVGGFAGVLQGGSALNAAITSIGEGFLPSVISTLVQTYGTINEGLNGTDTPNIPSFLVKQGQNLVQLVQKFQASQNRPPRPPTSVQGIVEAIPSQHPIRRPPYPVESGAPPLAPSKYPEGGYYPDELAVQPPQPIRESLRPAYPPRPPYYEQEQAYSPISQPQSQNPPQYKPPSQYQEAYPLIPETELTERTPVQAPPQYQETYPFIPETERTPVQAPPQHQETYRPIPARPNPVPEPERTPVQAAAQYQPVSYPSPDADTLPGEVSLSDVYKYFGQFNIPSSELSFGTVSSFPQHKPTSAYIPPESYPEEEDYIYEAPTSTLPPPPPPPTTEEYYGPTRKPLVPVYVPSISYLSEGEFEDFLATPAPTDPALYVPAINNFHIIEEIKIGPQTNAQDQLNGIINKSPFTPAKGVLLEAPRLRLPKPVPGQTTVFRTPSNFQTTQTPIRRTLTRRAPPPPPPPRPSYAYVPPPITTTHPPLQRVSPIMTNQNPKPAPSKGSSGLGGVKHMLSSLGVSVVNSRIQNQDGKPVYWMNRYHQNGLPVLVRDFDSKDNPHAASPTKRSPFQTVPRKPAPAERIQFASIVDA